MVAVDSRIAIVAIDGSLHIVAARNRASWGSVEGHFVLSILVHALNHIDLTVVGPVGTIQPKRWPSTYRYIRMDDRCSTTGQSTYLLPTTDGSGHVGQVKDDETIVVGLLALQTDTRPTVRSDVAVIYTHVCGSIGVDQPGI